jgi:hypothetical protein
MASDVLTVTKDIMDLFAKHDLTRIQSIFVLEAAKMSINEEITKEIIIDERKGHDTGHSGVM